MVRDLHYKCICKYFKKNWILIFLNILISYFVLSVYKIYYLYHFMPSCLSMINTRIVQNVFL